MIPNFDRIVDIGFALKEKTITGRCWHMTVILNKSKIWSIATNNYFKTHPKIREFNYCHLVKLHAELAACLKLGMVDCSGLSIINLRINKNGELCNSRFCLGCSDLIRKLNFSEAFYTDEAGDFQKFEFT